MKRFRKLALGAVSACVVAMTPVAANAGVIQLGFILDRSGSIGAGNWSIITSGLAAAVGLIPTGGPDTYELSVVTFSNAATTGLANFSLTNAADIASAQATITALGYSGGMTNYTAAFTLMDSVLRTTSANADKTYVNFATDGDPNPNSADGLAMRNSMISTALNGYVDNISIEAIGSGISAAGTALLQNQICYPTPCTVLPTVNFDAQGFYIQVADATEYAKAIQHKVRIVTGQVPEPTSIALVGAALLGLGFASRRKA